MLLNLTQRMPRQGFQSIVAADYKGPKAGFREAHVLKALVELDKRPAGRTKLGQLLNLGQGEIRTLIKRMKEGGFIFIDAKGCELTLRGRKQVSRIRESFPWWSSVEGSSLGIGRYCWAIIVRGGAKYVRMGIEQRDAAIKSGAAGVLTLSYSSGKFLIPIEGTDCEANSVVNEPWDSLRSGKPIEGDAVIISGADDPLSAEFGGWNAALTFSN